MAELRVGGAQLAQKLKELDEERTKGMEEATASIAELRAELSTLKESQGTMVEAAEAMGRAAKEQAEAAAAEAGGGGGFRLHVSRAIIRNPAQGKSYAAYQFEVSLNGRSNFFFQRWKLIDKFVADVRALYPLPRALRPSPRAALRVVGVVWVGCRCGRSSRCRRRSSGKGGAGQPRARSRPRTCATSAPRRTPHRARFQPSASVVL